MIENSLLMNCLLM